MRPRVIALFVLLLLGACGGQAPPTSQASPTPSEAQAKIDAFFTEVPGGVVSERDQERLRRIADALGAWNLGSSVDVWRRSLDARLSAASSLP